MANRETDYECGNTLSILLSLYTHRESQLLSKLGHFKAPSLYLSLAFHAGHVIQAMANSTVMTVGV